MAWEVVMTSYDPIHLCRVILLQFTVKAFFTEGVLRKK